MGAQQGDLVTFAINRSATTGGPAGRGHDGHPGPILSDGSLHGFLLALALEAAPSYQIEIGARLGGGEAQVGWLEPPRRKSPRCWRRGQWRRGA
eukprot:5886429-Pyramimonas_sp.AAC.1